MDDRNWIRTGAALVAIGIVLIVVGVLLAIIGPTPEPPPLVDYGGYRPHYQGSGTQTPGGRGGPICIVGTLADNQPDQFVQGVGTLRQCTGRRPGCMNTAATCARYALVAVSGTIDLLAGLGNLRVEDPFLTLACQTAPRATEGTGSAGPAGGLTIKGSVTINIHDVVVQHCRVRLTKNWGEAMTINVGDPITTQWTGWDVVLDHVSASWSTISGNVSMNYGSSKLAVLDSLMSESIRQYPSDGSYGYGTLVYSSDLCAFTLARSYLAHQQVRNPLVGAGCEAAIYDNLVYDAGDDYWASQGDAMAGNAFAAQAAGGAYAMVPFAHAYVSNVVVNGPTTSATVTKTLGILIDPDPGYVNQPHRIYLEDNRGPGITGSDQASGVQYFGAATPAALCDRSCFDANYAWFTNQQFAILPNAAVEKCVLENAGAFPAERDPVDARVLNDYLTKTGDAKLNSEADVGGFPELAQRTRDLAAALPKDPHAVAPGQTVRTNLETFLEADPAFGAQRLERWTGCRVVAVRRRLPPGLWVLAVALLVAGAWARERGKRRHLFEG